MPQYEQFGECLKRCLQENGLSASEASRLVGFRSRNSIFRILSGEASGDVKLRFLKALRRSLGEQWPQAHWLALQESLRVEMLGADRYRANQAFHRVLHEKEQAIPEFTVRNPSDSGLPGEERLADVLLRLTAFPRVEIIITGCCDSPLTRLLADTCGAAGQRGTLSIRHYIDTAAESASRNILGILPLVAKPWYNARLVAPGSCPEEMMSIYRMHALILHCWDEQGEITGRHYIRYDRLHFIGGMETHSLCPAVAVLDRWRFHLELLKDLPPISSGADVFLEYTDRYAQLEDNCAILSIKPDVHFNCIPAEVLEQSIIEGFGQSGLVEEPQLMALVEALKQVHRRRVDNTFNKHKPTHLVYSLPMMERFMRTGVLSDQFFIQRAYTVDERRQIIRSLLETMRSQPYFNVHFLHPGAPEPQYEISFYDGKGVMLMDAYTGYDLDADHSEALITLPTFMEDFRRYFQEELLSHYVISRAETIQALEQLLVMNIQA